MVVLKNQLNVGYEDSLNKSYLIFFSLEGKHQLSSFESK